MQTIVGTFDELEDNVPGCIYPHPMMYNIRTSFVGFITRYHYHKQQHCVYVEVSFLTTFFSINLSSWSHHLYCELRGQTEIRVDEVEDVHLFDI